jgi:hypothetical protein
MGSKTKISANGTYVLDPEDIEQLDELSLTSLINAIPEAQQPPKPPEAPAPDAGNTTINQILRGAPATLDASPRAAPPKSPEAAESTGDLIDPELIFSDPTPPRR